jgi:hypothetical protein
MLMSFGAMSGLWRLRELFRFLNREIGAIPGQSTQKSLAIHTTFPSVKQTQRLQKLNVSSVRSL